MTSASLILRDLSADGIKISRRGDNLTIEAKTGKVTSAIRESIAANKPALLTLLSRNDDQWKRLKSLAAQAGVSDAHVDGLSEADVSECCLLTDQAICAFLSMLAEDALRESGGVPADETAVMLCSHCGPVWTSPEVAAAMPRVNGWVRAIGCVWCHVRRIGKKVPCPPVMCGECRHFIRDAVNPFAGRGRCAKGIEHDRMYPASQHPCSSFVPSDEVAA